ncbi:hypothetical protein C1878_07285 [Gordonibacter sp. 28C]|uniref:NPXTG-anchored protein n=1 Tax=Gordonibacter sp. 28C TaxID=2078569 RepID=UPI000DF73473|nr:NPXTG-anchored protein [Gordonibacter sp. 28C]RDB62822.1 hypothetical protein C1878_07285 [Gordonibacter sp. 28C]
MKKKIVAIACAAAMMLALPTLAWAAPSPSNNGSVEIGGHNVSYTHEGGEVTIAPATTPAPNVKLEGSEQIVFSLEITAPQGTVVDAEHPLTLTVSLGSQFANANVKIFVHHSSDGTDEVMNAKANAAGVVEFTVTKLSTFTFVAAPTTAAADGSAKSPQTGVDFGTVAGATAVTAIAAGAVFVALRKKVTE